MTTINLIVREISDNFESRVPELASSSHQHRPVGARVVAHHLLILMTGFIIDTRRKRDAAEVVIVVAQLRSLASPR